jgi:integrase
MASITRHGNGWRVRIRRGGVNVSETFRTKAEASAWAVRREAEIIAGQKGQTPPGATFGDLLRRWRDEQIPRRDGGRFERVRIASLLGESGDGEPDPITLVPLAKIGPEHFAAWRDRRLASGVSPATVIRELNLLSSVCTTALNEWRWLTTHPVRGVKKPDPPPPRTRRISDDEIERILHACGDDYQTAQGRVGAAFLFAIETALRAGELCALRWDDVDLDRRVLTVRAEEIGARKTKTARQVPLSSRAVAIVEQLPRIGERVFALNKASLDALFRKAKSRALVEGLHFHDTRAEALTRLSTRLDALRLAKISGHRDLRILLATYYRESAEDVARLLD